MSYIPDVSRTLTLTGGVLAAGAVVVAETVSTDPTMGAGSYLLGGAGLVAALSAFSKDFWLDRQKQREHELDKLRLRGRGDEAARRALEALVEWTKAARAAITTLPPAPEISLKADDEHDD
jgi:hypothetical protein